METTAQEQKLVTDWITGLHLELTNIQWDFDDSDGRLLSVGTVECPHGDSFDLRVTKESDELSAVIVRWFHGAGDVLEEKAWEIPNPAVKLLAINVIAKLEAVFSMEKWWCGNCSATGDRGEELLVDSYGNARCPDCCSEEINEGTNKVGG